MDWLSQLTDSATTLLGAGANAYSTVASADALNHPQMTATGQLYKTGQPTAAGGISPTILLMGAALLLFVFIEK